MNRQAPVPTLQQRHDLERLLAQDRATRAARSMHRAVVPAAFPKMQPDEQRQPEPVNFCAVPEADADSSLLLLLLGVLAGMAAWALFGWAFWALVDALRWSA